MLKITKPNYLTILLYHPVPIFESLDGESILLRDSTVEHYALHYIEIIEKFRATIHGHKNHRRYNSKHKVYEEFYPFSNKKNR